MTNWPDKPLIRINRGKVDGDEIVNELAANRGDNEYVLFSTKHWHWMAAANCDMDSIDEWEEVTAVPTAALEDFKAAWKGFGMYDPDDSQRVTDAITSILACLPANKPSALDQAVTDTKNIGARGILEDFPLNDRIALLLSAVNEVNTGEDRRYRLAWVVRLAYTWADLEAPDKDALQIIRNHAATGVGGRSESLAILARQVGGVAAAVSDGRSPRAVLLALGARALAWAAEIIEEEGK